MGKAVPGPHPHAKFQHCMFESVGVKPPKSPKLLITGRPARIVFCSVVQKWVFRTAGATRCPINVKFGRRSRSAPPCQISQVRSLMPNFTFIGANMWEYSPKNCQNFEFWPDICTSGTTRLQYFYRILSICTRL